MHARVNWRQIPWETVNDNISRKMVVGERLMMIYYRFQPFQQWPTETHAAEQGIYSQRQNYSKTGQRKTGTATGARRRLSDCFKPRAFLASAG